VSWVADVPPKRAVRARVQVRHRHEGAWAEIEPSADGGARVRFESPVRAVAPGQAAVFYDGDSVVGGGWIEGPLP
jgi:tRNA-specific 2-thiouridylase